MSFVVRLLRRVDIRYRLIASFFLLSSLPLLVSGYIAYVESTRGIEDKARIFSTEVVNQVAKNVRFRMTEIDNRSSDLILSGRVQQALNENAGQDAKTRNAARREVAQLLLDHYGAADFVNQKYILDSRKRIADSQAFAQLTRGVQQFIEHAPVRDGLPYWGSYDNGVGQLSIGMLRTIADKTTNAVLGHLMLVIRPEHFSAIFDDVNLGSGSDIFIADIYEGRTVVRPRWQAVPRDDTVDPAMLEKIGRAPLIEDRSFVAFRERDGAQSFAAYKWIPGTTWLVVTTIREDTLTAEAQSVRYKIALIGFLCFLFAIAAAAGISLSISQPLDKLVRRMQETETGNAAPSAADAEIDTACDDELGKLSRSFAKMDARIRDKIKIIESQNRQLLETERQREAMRKERQRLVQDMHDGMGSSLETTLRLLEHGELDQAATAEVIKDCIDDLRLTVDSIEPVEADLLLLLATLRYRLASRMESGGIALRWEVSDVPHLNWLDPRNSLHILRILQEAFSNIVKHAQATEITVRTAVEGDGVMVSVADDGRGFDPPPANQGRGKGLTNQQMRAQAIGAKVAWETTSEGTRFSLWLPLKEGRAAPSCSPTREG